MQIAFWSTVHGQAATTSNAIGIACSIALEYRLKALITHNHFNKSTLESSLLEKAYLNTELTELKDTGIDALGRFIRFNQVDKESILNYTTTLLKGRLDLLIGTKTLNKDLYLSDLNTTIETILDSAKDYYDLLFIDVTSGNNEMSKKILSKADVVVVNLNQNLFVLEDFFKSEYEEIKEKCFFLLSMYSERSSYNLKNLKRRYKIKDNIGVIPYCRAFSDACNEGKAIDFFIKNIQGDEQDLHYYFIKEVRNSAKLLLNKVGIDIKNKRVGD